MKKENRKYTTDLKAGEKVEQVPFLLRKEGEQLVVADKKGTVNAVPAGFEFPEGDGVLGKVYLITGVLLKNKAGLILHIQSAVEAKEGEYCIPDIFSEIPPEKVDAYIGYIHRAICGVQHPGYRTLLEKTVTEEYLRDLGKLTIPEMGYCGNYKGASLAATCQVLYMAVQTATAYANKGNGLSHKGFDNDLLITAALLTELGRKPFTDGEDPYKKSRMGVTINYYAMLLLELQKAIVATGIELSEEDFGRLVNCLEVTVTNSSTRSITREGTVLRSIMALYRELDAYDWYLVQWGEPQEGEYYFASVLDKYILRDAGKEETEDAE